jgi:hypothetical protein
MAFASRRPEAPPELVGEGANAAGRNANSTGCRSRHSPASMRLTPQSRSQAHSTNSSLSHNADDCVCTERSQSFRRATDRFPPVTRSFPAAKLRMPTLSRRAVPTPIGSQSLAFAASRRSFRRYPTGAGSTVLDSRPLGELRQTSTRIPPHRPTIARDCFKRPALI